MSLAPPEEYLEQLKVLREIRAAASLRDDLPLPQICVIGATSAGKSSFLSRLTGVPFPQGSDMCTKGAVVVDCSQSVGATTPGEGGALCTPSTIAAGAARASSSSSSSSEVAPYAMEDVGQTGGHSGTESGDGALVPLQDSSASLLKKGNANNNEPTQAQNKTKAGYTYKVHDGTKYVPCKFEEVARKISKRQDALLREAFPQFSSGDVSKLRQLTKEEIKVEASGPDLADLSLVDLPGFVQNDGDQQGLKEKIEELVISYIQKKNTLICVVSEAKETQDNVGGLQLARKYDPTGERTIQVLTKFDVFDQPEARARAVKWVYNDVEQGKQLGRHAIINRNSYGIELTPDDEVAELQKMQLPFAACGITAFRERATPLFAELIKTNIVPLGLSLNKKLRETTMELDKLGRRPPRSDELITRVKTQLGDNTPRLQQDLSTRAFIPFQTAVEGVKSKLTLEYTTKNFGRNVFVCSTFQGGEVFDDCLRRIKNEWEPILEKYMTSAIKVVSDSAEEYLRPIRIPLLLKNTVATEFRAFCKREVNQYFRDECSKALELEVDFGTANAIFQQNFARNELLPDRLREIMEKRFEWAAESMKKKELNASTFLREVERSVCEYVDEIHSACGSASTSSRSGAASSSAAVVDVFADPTTTADEQSKQRIHSAVLATFHVESRTLVDAVLKHTRSTLLSMRKVWVDNRLQELETVQKNAQEPPQTQKKRQALEQQEERLDYCWTRMQLLGGGNIFNADGELIDNNLQGVSAGAGAAVDAEHEQDFHDASNDEEDEEEEEEEAHVVAAPGSAQHYDQAGAGQVVDETDLPDGHERDAKRQRTE